MTAGPATGGTRAAMFLDWMDAGQRRLEEMLAPLDDAAFAQPSRLPGWTRGHVVTHLARNADALVNLLTWARTGVPTPMYPSAESRNAGIEDGAGRPAALQRDDLAASARRLMETAQAVPPGAWEARVQSAQGRDIPASEVPWMRVREVWIHLADLDAGAGFEAMPDAVAIFLVLDVARWMAGRVDRRIEITGPGVTIAPFGGQPDQPPVRVRGSAQALAAWLTGRSRGDGLTAEPEGPIPELPAWL